MWIRHLNKLISSLNHPFFKLYDNVNSNKGICLFILFVRIPKSKMEAIFTYKSNFFYIFQECHEMKQFHSLSDSLKHLHNNFPFSKTQYYSPTALDMLSLLYWWYVHMWPWAVRREGTPGRLVQTVSSSSMLIWRRFSWNDQLPVALCTFSSAPHSLTSRRLWTNSADLHLVMCVFQNLGLPMTALSSLAVCVWPGFRSFDYGSRTDLSLLHLELHSQ